MFLLIEAGSSFIHAFLFSLARLIHEMLLPEIPGIHPLKTAKKRGFLVILESWGLFTYLGFKLQYIIKYKMTITKTVTLSLVLVHCWVKWLGKCKPSQIHRHHSRSKDWQWERDSQTPDCTFKGKPLSWRAVWLNKAFASKRRVHFITGWDDSRLGLG